VSYWLLRGRCRTCGSPFSIRYFLVELGTALAFIGLYYLEIYRNVSQIPELNQADARFAIEHGVPSLRIWAGFAHHAVLLSFLIAVSLCDIDHLEIPLSISVSGTLVGLVAATCFAWPFPNTHWQPPAVPAVVGGIDANPRPPAPGLYPWPVWTPLPQSLPEHSWQLGLATGLAGAAVGSIVLRMVRFLFGVGRGIEGLGIGDADLMMMAGSFVGWQVILVAFPIAAIMALVVALAQACYNGKQAMPFGPTLSMGVIVALLGWRWFAEYAWKILSDPVMMTILGIFCPVMFLAITFILRLIHGGQPPEEPDTAEKVA
jgi:leader peptidase (prepilin peptidase) / N-methyltransferase